MKLTLSAIQNINVLGELLRDLFFEQKHGIGCLETFIRREQVILLDEVTVEHLLSFQWRRSGFNIDDDYVEMWYYWYGRGTLVFVLADFVLLNSDCAETRWKKISHKEWQYYRLG